jgi:hypothetical protein
MNQQTITILFWISPILTGGIIAALNSEGVNNATEKAEAWVLRNQENASKKKGILDRYLINPVLYTVVIFIAWTDSFTHRGIKNGARVAATLYLIAAWCFLLYTAFMIALFLAIMAVVIYVVYKILVVVFKVAVNTNTDDAIGYQAGRAIINTNLSGNRHNTGTSGSGTYDVKYWDAGPIIHTPLDEGELYGCEITDSETGLVGTTHRARSSKTKAHDDAWEDLMQKRTDYNNN